MQEKNEESSSSAESSSRNKNSSIVEWFGTTEVLRKMLEFEQRYPLRVIIGYDKLPVASMNCNGLVIWAKNNEIQMVNIKRIRGIQVNDGERLPLSVKEFGSCDFHPQCLFDFNRFANVKHIFGGKLLALCYPEMIVFYYWREFHAMGRFFMDVKNVYWAESGKFVTLVQNSSFSIVKYNYSSIPIHVNQPTVRQKEELRNLSPELYSTLCCQWIEEEDNLHAFDILFTISERIRSGIWVGDYFIFINYSSQVNYCVGRKVTTMFDLDRPMHLLGYWANRVYLIDTQFNVRGHTLPPNLIPNEHISRFSLGRDVGFFRHSLGSRNARCCRGNRMLITN